MNQSELLEFDVRANSHQPSRAVRLAPQLREAILDKFVKKLKYKEVMADRLVNIYFIWQQVTHCPQVSVFLPPMRTKLGTVLEDFTLSLVCVHIFCKAELEEERNTTKALRSKKISGEYFYISILLFNLLLLTHCIVIFTKTMR
jgi:hypothetical protein